MAIAYIIVFLLTSTFLAFNKPRIALLAAVFSVPWNGIYVDIGLGVSAYLLLIAPLCSFYLINALCRSGTYTSPGMGTFGWVIAYAIVWTVGQLPFLPDMAISGGGLRQPAVRSIAQIVMFLITISPVWIIPSVVKSRSDLMKIGRVYLLSVALLAAIGWLQLAVWMATGSDPFPVNFFNELLGGQGSQRSGIFNYMGASIYRMSSFGGEPKGLGVGLAVGLLLLQAGVKPQGRFTTWLWPFLFVSLISTFSTMAILCWLVTTIFQIFVTPRGTIKAPKIDQSFRGLVRWSCWLIPIIFALVISGKGLSILEMIEIRTTSRIVHNEQGAVEEFNSAVLNFLVDKPFWVATGTGLGNAHLYANSYLPSYAVRYAYRTTFVAKSGALRWISEIGIISLFAFLIWLTNNALRTFDLAHRFKDFSEIATITSRFIFPLLIFWTVSGYIIDQLFITIGFLFSLGLQVRAMRLNSLSNTARSFRSTKTTTELDMQNRPGPVTLRVTPHYRNPKIPCVRTRHPPTRRQ